MALLEAKKLGISFGGLRAVDDFNISIEKGALYGLIGPNGAGKTTVFNLLTGVYKPTEGIITLDGKDITGKKTIDINQAGIARTFQNIRLFDNMTVLDNVIAGFHDSIHYNLFESITHLGRFRTQEKEIKEKAIELLKVIDIDKEKKFLAQVFQALRIEVNDEMRALREMLRATLKVLKPGGRLVVITYHSLEDRLVKNFLKSGNFEGKAEQDFFGNVQSPFRLVNNKVIVPSSDEIERNPRSRSAKLRIAERK